MNSTDVIKIQGDSLQLKGDYMRAVECYEEVLRRDPNDFNTIMSLSAVYHALGDETKAGYLIADATERLATGLSGHDISHLMVTAIRHYFVVGSPELAMKELQRAQYLVNCRA